MTVLPYQLIRSQRKSVSLQVTLQGQIIVRCPLKFPKKEIDRILESKRPWLEEKLALLPTAPEVLTPEALKGLAQAAKVDLSERAARFAPKAGVSYGRITIRAQRGRWGSCSSQGNLSLNCLLMLAPPEVRDYVIVHELCHRLHMDHSNAFWTEVERILPDYRERKQWLKENGTALLLRLP